MILSENDPVYKYIEDCVGTALNSAAKSTLRNKAANWKGGSDAAAHFLAVYGVTLGVEVAAKIFRDLTGKK
jgi:hypothetical protein